MILVQSVFLLLSFFHAKESQCLYIQFNQELAYKAHKQFDLALLYYVITGLHTPARITYSVYFQIL